MIVINTLLEVENLKKYYIGRKTLLNRSPESVKAVDGVSLKLNYKETFGLVGESGCGKSTLGKTILKLEEPNDGKIIFEGKDITNLNKKQMKDVRKDIQMIFQNPYGSLNPRKTIYQSVEAPLNAYTKYSEADKREIIENLLDSVGLSKEDLNKFPHQMSGGQRQRVVILRSIVNNPKFIVCDEPVSALDVSVRSQVLNLLQELQEKLGLTYLFISHDLSVVNYICDKVAIMYLGKIVEQATTQRIFENVMHPYTQALISAIPSPEVDKDKKRIILKGDIPSPINPPSGCSFHPRCPYSMPICETVEPPLVDKGNDHLVACHLYD